MSPGFFLIGIIFVIAICLYLPYWLKTKDLKKIRLENLPSVGDWAKLSKGNIYYRWHEPKEKNGQTIAVSYTHLTLPTMMSV